MIQLSKALPKIKICVYFNIMKETIKRTKDVISPPSLGTTIEGKIVGRDRFSIFVDLGIYGTGIIYGKEFYDAKDIIKNLKTGDKIYAKIIELENDDGYRELSLKEATQELSWGKLKEKKERGEILSVKISGANKGGLLCNVDGVAGFLPVSQLSPEHYPRVEDAEKQKILKELQKFIGKTLELKILDLLPQENKLILSEKAKLEDKIKEILKQYKNGDVVQGQISGIADFGVFIRFPSPSESSGRKSAQSEKTSETPAQVQKTEKSQAEGLIHISELDWQLVEDPSEIVKVGDIVKAKIIEINDNGQVFLSLKSLKKNPWEGLEKKYKKGDIVEGKVVAFSPFGVFAEILPKIRGLCHISEFGTKSKMEDVLKIGKKYDFEITSLDPKEYRLGLKLAKSK